MSRGSGGLGVAVPSELDVAELSTRLEDLGRRHRWWRPIGYVGVALLGLAGALVTLTRNWRLVLLEIVPAVWLGAISWQWRRVVLFGDDRPVVSGVGAAGVTVLVIAATSTSYWCNVTFALTVRRTGRPDIRSAFAQARARRLPIWAAALASSALHVAVVVWLVRVDGSWFGLGLGAVAVLQMYAFVAVPVLVATGRRQRRPWPDRIRSSTASLGLSGMTAAPGVMLNRAGVLLLGTAVLRWLGMVLVAVAAVAQVAGISSAAALKFASRLGEPVPAPPRSPDQRPPGPARSNRPATDPATPRQRRDGRLPRSARVGSTDGRT